MEAAQNNQIRLTEDEEKKHIYELTQKLTEATNQQVHPHEVIPIKNQHPLPQFEHPLALQPGDKDVSKTPDHGILGVIEGLQGKPRTANAIDFLKSKLSWMKKKYGEVTLRK